jgi:hypothetical protein
MAPGNRISTKGNKRRYYFQWHSKKSTRPHNDDKEEAGPEIYPGINRRVGPGLHFLADVRLPIQAEI